MKTIIQFIKNNIIQLLLALLYLIPIIIFHNYWSIIGLASYIITMLLYLRKIKKNEGIKDIYDEIQVLLKEKKQKIKETKTKNNQTLFFAIDKVVENNDYTIETGNLLNKCNITKNAENYEFINFFCELYYKEYIKYILLKKVIERENDVSDLLYKGERKLKIAEEKFNVAMIKTLQLAADDKLWKSLPDEIISKIKKTLQ